MSHVPPTQARSGLSARGTLLLALVGVAVVVFLFVVFPRLATSRAEESGAKRVPHVQAEEEPPPVEEAVLLTPEMIVEQPVVVPETTPAAPASPQGGKKPQALKYAKGSGKYQRVDPKSMQQKYKAKRDESAKSKAQADKSSTPAAAPRQPKKSPAKDELTDEKPAPHDG